MNHRSHYKYHKYDTYLWCMHDGLIGDSVLCFLAVDKPYRHFLFFSLSSFICPQFAHLIKIIFSFNHVSIHTVTFIFTAFQDIQYLFIFSIKFQYLIIFQAEQDSIFKFWVIFRPNFHFCTLFC